MLEGFSGRLRLGSFCWLDGADGAGDGRAEDVRGCGIDLGCDIFGPDDED